MTAHDSFREYRQALAAWEEEGWRRAVPARFRGAQVSDLDAGLSALVAGWALEPSNLLLVGPAGSGKTHAAVAACRERWALTGRAPAFWHTAALLDALRPDGRLEDVHPLVAADVLVLDDLGAQKVTEWVQERLDLIVNARWAENRPVIVTSNFPPERLAATVGERLWSRLQDGARIVTLVGRDRRAR